MTSDAKIGLLLGLVFIFIIAFVINGLPDFWQSSRTNELTTNMVRSQNNQLGIASSGRKVSQEIIEPVKEIHKPSTDFQPVAEASPEIRFKTQLPKTKIVNKAEASIEAKGNLPKTSEKIETGVVRRALSNKKALSKFHIVRAGESLTVISRKFYGTKEGSKLINISRIFQANRKVLKSQDEIYVGQKLVIPSLDDSDRGKSKMQTMASRSIFNKVKSIGRRNLSADKGKISPTKWYVVREDDSLWRIAEKHLGNSERYPEIAELNAKALEDEDNLAIGMRLRIPVK